ncbi:MAG: hypothetical protein QW057_07450, partial [Candidatus Bathyarchaeia archaeon]
WLTISIVLALTSVVLASTYSSYIVVDSGTQGSAGVIPSTGTNQQLFSHDTAYAWLKIKTPQESAPSGTYHVKVTAYVTMYWKVYGSWPSGYGSSFIYLGARAAGKWYQDGLVFSDTAASGQTIERNGYTTTLQWTSTSTVTGGDAVEAYLEWHGESSGIGSYVHRLVSGQWTYALLQVHSITIEYVP